MSDIERKAFLATIQATPDDLTPRLVYADWLDERDDSDGELVRLLCEVQQSDYADGPAWERFESLVGDLEIEIGRLDERDRRLLLCDLTERSLPAFRRKYPLDERPRGIIEKARRYAASEPTRRLNARDVGVMGLADLLRFAHEVSEAETDAEHRWDLCRAIEYRLGFVPLLEFDDGEPTPMKAGTT